MPEPTIDLSEIIGLYKEDALLTIGKMRAAWSQWSEIQKGGAIRNDLRRMSHQLRGSGRTYGFRRVTRVCKAIENITIKIEQAHLKTDDRVRQALEKKLTLLAAAFDNPERIR